MPDWLSWLELPELTDSEYTRKKAEYIAEHGYTITIPGLSDIIKIPTVEPMTPQEHIWWKARAWKNFSDERYEELKKEKQKRKDRYLRMLASPTPVAMTNIGSVMTAIDDAQDGLNTLAVIGMIASRVAPKAIGSLLYGPVGILMTIADTLNLIQAVPQIAAGPMVGKRVTESFNRASPFSKKGRARRAAKLRRSIPTKGDWIQALQTTEDVFGFGVCLGPILGMAQDLLFGYVRTRTGQPVDIKFPVPDLKHWSKAAMKVAKASTLMFGIPLRTNDDEVLQWITATELAWQHLSSFNQAWNPLDQVENIATAEIKSPVPWHSQTLEILEENGVDVSKSSLWPQTNTPWASVEYIADSTQDIAKDNLRHFTERNKHSWRGFVGASAATEGSMFAVSALEGPETIEYDYNAASKIAVKMLKYNHRLDPNQPTEKFDLFLKWIQYNEKFNQNPTWREIERFCNGLANIKLLGG